MDKRTQRMNTQICMEASEWFVELRDREPDERTRRDFDRWLRSSPEHLSAYLEIAAIWSDASALDPGHRWTRDALIDAARASRENVVSLVAPGPAPKGEPVASQTSRRRLVAAFAGLLGAAGVSGLFLASADATRFDTKLGEQRSVVLPDGSTVDLNSRSRLEIRYSDDQRAVVLLEGQALFDVVRDPARPFIVTSGNTRVRAVGTQFDVYRKREGTVVTVVEGRVAVAGTLDADARPGAAKRRGPAPAGVASAGDAGSGSAEVVLAAGGQVIVTEAAIHAAEHPNVTGAIAWRQRQLVFDSASLAEVAEEFNRYNTRQLVVEPAGLDDFFISGVFSSTDPASLLRFLRERPEVQVTETAAEIRVTKNIH